MPYLVLLLCLVFSACKKGHQVSHLASVSSNEQRSFIVIAHAEGESVIRNKLLNAIVEEKFPQGREESIIKESDELKGHAMSERDIKFYSEKESLMTKLVVSFSDRTEIYFLPPQMFVSDIAGSLNLAPEANKTFKWLKREGELTEAKKTLYLVSVNHEDLMENDKKYYKEFFDLKDLSVRTTFKVEKFREVILGLNYQFFKERPVMQNFTGRTVKCNRDLAEAGMCGQCVYKKLVPSGFFDKIENPSLDELGVYLSLDDQNVFLSGLGPQMIAPGQVSFQLKVESFAGQSLLKIDLEKRAPGSYSVGSNAVRDHLCKGDEGAGNISLNISSQLELKVEILGRGERLKEISL